MTMGGRDAPAGADSFARYMDHVASAFAMTRGGQHRIAYANSAFRSLVASHGDVRVGDPIVDVFPARDRAGLATLLDRAFRVGVATRNRLVASVADGTPALSCTIWPELAATGETEHLLIEVRYATPAELTNGLQRDVAERLLLSALREQDATVAALESRKEALFLASESHRLAASLDETATLAAMERMALPHLGAWCVVDTLDDDDVMHRLAIVHPDPAKQAILAELEGRWTPQLGDAFGLPAALRGGGPMAIVHDADADAAIASGAHDPETLSALRQLGVGPLLTIPLTIRDRMIGAVTFVGARDGSPFTTEDIALAEDLALRSAMALDRARLYGEALSLKVLAESANHAKSAFLGMMSHELRTPLNAIAGYVDLLSLEVHGPLNTAQQMDVGRIRTNQRYLTGLINDLLNLTKVGSGHLAYDLRDFSARDMLEGGLALVEPLIAQKGLLLDGVAGSGSLYAHADWEKVLQILVNLLSNAIKFTQAGGRLVLDCLATDRTIMLRVCDTGIGIPADKQESIFEPFIQLKAGVLGPEAGIGLGLSISRSLARGMHGDLTVQSTLGEGARFTLTLPRVAVPTPNAVAAP